MPAKLYRGPGDLPNEGMVDLMVERFQSYYDDAGFPVIVESVHSGIRKEDKTWDKQFTITVDVAQMETPGEEQDLDQPPRRIWRRLGVNQPVFDVHFVALILDRGPNYDKSGFWGLVTQMSMVLSKEIFGPGTRPATAVFSHDVPEQLLKDFGFGNGRYVSYSIPAYFAKQSYQSPVIPELKTVITEAEKSIYPEYTGDWPPIRLWKNIVANGAGSRGGLRTFTENTDGDPASERQLTRRGEAVPFDTPPPY